MSTGAPPKPTGANTNHSRSDPSTRLLESKKSRLAALWPEWTESILNDEPWDIGSGKKKETTGNKARTDVKSASSAITHGFEDPEGKIELPPAFKVDQWKRPIDFLSPDRPPVVVDQDLGLQNFDLVRPNEHLHYNEIMRNIISQITALWDICRRDRKSTSSSPDNVAEMNLAVINGRTWRPWEHIYALNKVSRQPFITPYNPAGKYVVRLFFLGTWRKIVVDDTIPFDIKNQCLLPQTSLSHELWPMLLTKALLKIIALDFGLSNSFSEFNETSIIHCLTGWLPEPIPLKYTHAKKVWEFLRYDRSNKLPGEFDNEKHKSDQQTLTPTSGSGPVPLFKWPEQRTDLSEEFMSIHDQSGQHDDTATESYTKKSDEKSPKKGGATASLSLPKDNPGAVKALPGKDSRIGGGMNTGTIKDAKKVAGGGKGLVSDESTTFNDDQTIPEAPKMIVFATTPRLRPTRSSSYSETADRSERLRRYNLNETFSSSMLLTSLRDIPLERPPPQEVVPSWKLIRPKKPKILPHAEPLPPPEVKPERWIEIASPYINFPTGSSLQVNLHPSGHVVHSRLSRSATHSTAADVPDIVEVDEEGDIENGDGGLDNDSDQKVVEAMSPNQLKRDGLTPMTREINATDLAETRDESIRGSGSKIRREKSADKNKGHRKLAGSKLDVTPSKAPSDIVSVKSKGAESDAHATPMDIHTSANAPEQQESQSKSTHDIVSNQGNIRSTKTTYTTPKIWMDFDDFCACFTTVIVFHNPRGYQNVQKHTEVKPVVSALIKEKKKEANAPIPPQPPKLQDEKSPLYLFVDSTRDNLTSSIELLISLSSLSRWYELPSNETTGIGGISTQATNEKSGKVVGLPSDKTSADVSPARGLGGRQRTSTVDTLPQTPASNTGQHEGSQFDGSQKDSNGQPGSLIAELYSWKSLSMGQPTLRLHSSATKAALLKLPPGRHVLKFTISCPLAYHLQIMSDTHDFTLGDEDNLLRRVESNPEDAEFSARAEELFSALDDAVQNFNHDDLQNKSLNDLFSQYCNFAPPSAKMTIDSCWKAFNEALYATLRTFFTGSGSTMTTETQFAWRCFTNDLCTPDIVGVYEARRSSNSGASRNSARAGTTTGNATTTTAVTSVTPGKKGNTNKDKTSDEKSTSKQQTQVTNSTSIADVQEEPTSEWLSKELTINEINAIVSIQKIARGYLQRRILLARTPNSEKNIQTQQALINCMNTLKIDSTKAAGLLFRNLMISKPNLIQCFHFRSDDWNMVSYRDFTGQYPEQTGNTWFVLFREVFYVTEESFVSAKLLTHSTNSLLRVINNDTYEEMPLVFNRLAPSLFSKNKYGYTFFAESLTLDQPISAGQFRLRLITSYTHLPEPRIDPITSSFATKEIKDYYTPNKQKIICRYRVNLSDDANQTNRNFHLASIQFSASKSDALIRLSVFDNHDELARVEGKGAVVLPAFLFMRDSSSNTQIGATQTTSRPTSKTGTSRKDVAKGSGANTHRGSLVESMGLGSGRSDREKIGSGKRSRSSSRTGVMADDEEKPHKYIIQVTLLRKSWPLTPTQWQFVEQLKEQERNELRVFNRQPSAGKVDGTTGSTIGGAASVSKRAGQTSANVGATAGKGKSQNATGGSNKVSSTGSGRPGTGKAISEKNIDTSKAHWTLRIVSDAEKADEINVRKDTERNEELINMKRAWETHEAGRSQKAMKARQKFLDSLQPKSEDGISSGSIDLKGKTIDGHQSEDANVASATINSALNISDQQQAYAPSKSAVALTTSKKSASSTGNKKGTNKDDTTKQTEHSTTPQELMAPPPLIDEPLLEDPPPTKPKITLPPLDVKPFVKNKMLTEEPIVLDQLFEHEEELRRQADFLEFKKFAEQIRHYREEDHSNRYKEKIRQLEEYIDLQAKIDRARRIINEPREAFRQRFLEVERKRLAELAALEQELMAAAEKNKTNVAASKGKGSAGKKGKK